MIVCKKRLSCVWIKRPVNLLQKSNQNCRGQRESQLKDMTDKHFITHPEIYINTKKLDYFLSPALAWGSLALHRVCKAESNSCVVSLDPFISSLSPSTAKDHNVMHYTMTLCRTLLCNIGVTVQSLTKCDVNRRLWSVMLYFCDNFTVHICASGFFRPDHNEKLSAGRKQTT